MQKNYKDLLESIKNDNVENFSILFNDKLQNVQNLCFGRFPLLSVCYLYSSKKIIKKFENQLLNIRASKLIEEPFEIYQKFKSVAGRCLRLYVNGQIVQPLEMLAILGKDKKVKKHFKLLTIANKNVDNLNVIYQIKLQNFSVKNKKIKVSQSPLNQRQKGKYKIAFFASLVSVFVLGFALVFSWLYAGLGLNGSALKIYSNKQLYSALNSNQSYSLQTDIFINEDFCIDNFEGHLDGNNHCVFVNLSSVNDALIKVNKGEIKNLKIVYGDIQKDVSSNFSLFVGKNFGTLKNINISCSNLNLTCNKTQDKDIFVNGVANENIGSIDNCNLTIKAQVTATQKGNCFFSGIVGENYSNLTNCQTLKDCEINTVDAHASGIASFNDIGANVTNCKNNAKIAQTSNTSGWSPKVSGIVLTNYGNIKKCFNLNLLKASSTFDEQSAKGNVFLGGISCSNYGVIESSLNKADLQASSKSLIIYTGGIAAHSSYYKKDGVKFLPIIKGCGVSGNISSLLEGDNLYSFVGGIAGFLYGELINNYSLATFSQNYNIEQDIIGTVLGSAYVEGKVILLNILNNVVLSSSSTEVHIGCLVNDGSIVSAGLNTDSSLVLTAESEQEVMAKEVYWSE